MTAELDLALDGATTLRETDVIAAEFERELFAHMPALAAARIRVRSYDAVSMGGDAAAAMEVTAHGAGHHHAPAPVAVHGHLADGVVEIVDTPGGERMQFTAAKAAAGLHVTVIIQRDHGRIETLPLAPIGSSSLRFVSAAAPEEPHEFDAQLRLQTDEHNEVLSLHFAEPHVHVGAR